ncbi:MAG: HAMP domain-containing sensor histidine kinase [Ilumatobacteraceae bacterium]
MTLRTRVVVIVSTLVIAGIAIASFFAYDSTRRELVQETDRFLDQRADELVGGQRQQPQNSPGNDNGNNNANSNNGNGDGSGGDTTPRLTDDPDALSQTLDRNGAITASSAEALPVTEADIAVADGATSITRDIALDGAPYRMITQHDRKGGAVQVARATSGTEDVLAGLRTQLLVFGVALAVLAALLGWLLMRRTTQPLEDLTRATERVAATSDLTPLRLDRNDEVGRLANSFDSMLGALALSREQQQRLVQDAAHELRTPLTSLRANIELLDRARNLPEDELDALLGGLDAEVQELSQLFDELIQLATDASAGPHADVDVDLADVVDGAVDRFVRRTGREVSVASEPTPMRGDPALLERAVTNLLGNAHKFSAETTPITVELRDRRVTVTDHGPGIPADERERVFDRFYRSDVARSQPGSGLGLAIVRQIAEQHGGSASAGETADGGATVSFSVGRSVA